MWAAFCSTTTELTWCFNKVTSSCLHIVQQDCNASFAVTNFDNLWHLLRDSQIFSLYLLQLNVSCWYSRNVLLLMYSGDNVLHLTLIDMSDSHRCAVHTQCQISPRTFTSDTHIWISFILWTICGASHD